MNHYVCPSVYKCISVLYAVPFFLILSLPPSCPFFLSDSSAVYGQFGHTLVQGHAGIHFLLLFPSCPFFISCSCAVYGQVGHPRTYGHSFMRKDINNGCPQKESSTFLFNAQCTFYHKISIKLLSILNFI